MLTAGGVASGEGRQARINRIPYYLVPLSFLWDGITLLLATPASNPTGRNLQATGKVRLGIGPTRDGAWIIS